MWPAHISISGFSWLFSLHHHLRYWKTCIQNPHHTSKQSLWQPTNRCTKGTGNHSSTITTSPNKPFQLLLWVRALLAQLEWSDVWVCHLAPSAASMKNSFVAFLVLLTHIRNNKTGKMTQTNDKVFLKVPWCNWKKKSNLIPGVCIKYLIVAVYFTSHLHLLFLCSINRKLRTQSKRAALITLSRVFS